MVDGVLASCYASIDHDLAHIGMAPVCRFPMITGWIFGKENESLGYVNILIDVGEWLLPQGKNIITDNIKLNCV